MGGLSWEKILVDGHRAKSSNYIGSAGRCEGITKVPFFSGNKFIGEFEKVAIIHLGRLLLLLNLWNKQNETKQSLLLSGRNELYSK